MNSEEEVSCAHDGNSMSDDPEPGTASSKQQNRTNKRSRPPKQRQSQRPVKDHLNLSKNQGNTADFDISDNSVVDDEIWVSDSSTEIVTPSKKQKQTNKPGSCPKSRQRKLTAKQ